MSQVLYQLTNITSKDRLHTLEQAHGHTKRFDEG